MSNLVPFEHQTRIAAAIAKSGLFGIKTEDQALALMAICEADGIHPAKAAQEYVIIQGRPALKADAMMARFQRAGGSVSWSEYTDKSVTGVFSHPKGGEISITWTIEMATKIGLAGKDNWRNYPRAMLRARCISEGIRTVYPGCVVGTYSVEEVQDFDDGPQKAQKPARRAVEVSDVAEAVLAAPAPVEAVMDITDGHALMVPGLDAPFSHHTTVEAWIGNYASLVKRILNSGKVTDEVKKQKQTDLEAANKAFISSMNAMDRTNLRAALAEVGAVSFPKGSAAETEAEEELLRQQQSDQIEE